MVSKIILEDTRLNKRISLVRSLTLSQYVFVNMYWILELLIVTENCKNLAKFLGNGNELSGISKLEIAVTLQLIARECVIGRLNL